DQAKLDYGIVFRQSEQPVPVPSIVHWKFGHYSAIVGEVNGKFHIQDPAFQRDLWVTRDAINNEASGYFLAPTQIELAELRQVDIPEASQVRGMWATTQTTPPSGGNPPDDNSKTKNPCGCTVYSFRESSVSLLLQDTPVGYVPPIGPPVKVTISYN